IAVETSADTVALAVPLNVAFGNPDLLHALGVGPVLASLAAERQYKNDEQIDNSLRSVLFQVPRPGIPDPTVCGTPVVNPDCFTGVSDLGAIDIQRGRDHGMPSYNELRRAYGLAPRRSFTEITGESTDRFPVDAAIDPRDPIDDPRILDFLPLLDAPGHVIPFDSDAADEDDVLGIRRTTRAGRASPSSAEGGEGALRRPQPHRSGARSCQRAHDPPELGDLRLGTAQRECLRQAPVVAQLFSAAHVEPLPQVVAHARVVGPQRARVVELVGEREAAGGSSLLPKAFDRTLLPRDRG